MNVDMEELEYVLQSLKNSRAAGPDNIPNEFFKAMPAEGIDFILKLFNDIIQSNSDRKNTS